jgi:ATP-dependent Clp protease adaptor protein ClpS
MSKTATPDIDIEEGVKLDEAIAALFNNTIVLYNDDVNSFEHVINCLVKYCEHAPMQAEQCAIIVHNNGKCGVKGGSMEELKPIAEALLENGLSVKIE